MKEIKQAFQISIILIIATIVILVDLLNEIFLGWILTPTRRKKDWDKRQVFFF